MFGKYTKFADFADSESIILEYTIEKVAILNTEISFGGLYYGKMSPPPCQE